MPSITIDDKTFAFEGKKMILQVALENGFEIPHYCYHPGLSIVASCRICLAEVEAPDPRQDGKLSLIPKLVPTCQTPAADGMVVHINSPKSVANQKAVMEYLLINHPLDCPVCDQAGECYLQDYSYRYGRSVSRFEEDKIKQATKDIGPHVKLYADRCIMCSRCVRFTREVTGTGEIGVFGRGAYEQIDIFPGKPLDNELSGNVVDICPVGALLDKDFLFEQRVWYLKETPSIDGITASGDNLWIHHNEGRIYRFKPRTNSEVNQWWLTDEVRYGWDFVHREDRLTWPSILQFGDRLTLDWLKAAEEVAENFKRILREAGDGAKQGDHPGEKVSPLAALISPMLSCEEAYLLGKFMRSLDPDALLGVGPVPRSGEDKTFPSGFTVSAEKAPNARGVRRALELLPGDKRTVTGKIYDYDEWLERVGDKKSTVKGVLITGNYPSEWTTKELVSGLRGKFTVLIDTLPTALSEKADVLLPGAPWTEKAGTFENARHRLQSFRAAVGVLEGAKPEGQIALDLAAAAGVGDRAVYDDAAVRAEMGGAFDSDVHHPVIAVEAEPDMAYVEF